MRKAAGGFALALVLSTLSYIPLIFRGVPENHKAPSCACSIILRGPKKVIKIGPYCSFFYYKSTSLSYINNVDFESTCLLVTLKRQTNL